MAGGSINPSTATSRNPKKHGGVSKPHPKTRGSFKAASKNTSTVHQRGGCGGGEICLFEAYKNPFDQPRGIDKHFVPSVFGRNLQCKPVRGVNFLEECHWILAYKFLSENGRCVHHFCHNILASTTNTATRHLKEVLFALLCWWLGLHRVVVVDLVTGYGCPVRNPVPTKIP
jgi:hypothetical protein